MGQVVIILYKVIKEGLFNSMKFAQRLWGNQGVNHTAIQEKDAPGRETQVQRPWGRPMLNVRKTAQSPAWLKKVS